MKELSNSFKSIGNDVCNPINHRLDNMTNSCENEIEEYHLPLLWRRERIFLDPRNWCTLHFCSSQMLWFRPEVAQLHQHRWNPGPDWLRFPVDQHLALNLCEVWSIIFIECWKGYHHWIGRWQSNGFWTRFIGRHFIVINVSYTIKIFKYQAYVRDTFILISRIHHRCIFSYSCLYKRGIQFIRSHL